ncbi:MAG: class I SAM-dependent methyltransferase [Nanoarchaeota archaeon]|nr:class I SAM-dependent methyltransferase [Nanoarchaeota archaeon]
MGYKEETMEVYDRFSDVFDKKFQEYADFIKEKLERASKKFPSKAKIIDIGSGTGNHALFFKQKGFDVLCLDFSDKVLNHCKEKGLNTIKMDFEELNLPEKSFDVVWAYTSLLHIPKKNIEKVIGKIKEILKDKGLFVVSFKEGEGEGFVDFKEGGRRWFSLYTNEEARELLERHFDIIDSWSVCINDKTFLDYVCTNSF